MCIIKSICFVFLIFWALLQFFVKVCCSLLYEEGSNASWVSTSLLYFVIFCFPIVCRMKRFLHLAWWSPRNKTYAPIYVKDLFSNISECWCFYIFLKTYKSSDILWANFFYNYYHSKKCYRSWNKYIEIIYL